jgi:hypothetical protein
MCPEGTYCGHPLEYGISLENDGVYDDFQIGYSVINFDNIGKAMISVFQIITMDSWSLQMYNLMDSNIAIMAALYYSLLILFGSFFLLNLILAVILDSFTKVQQQELHAILHENRDGHLDQILQQMEADSKALHAREEEIK